MIGEGGKVVREVMTDSAQDPLRITVDGITRDAAFTITIEACNILLCRRCRVLELCEWRDGGGGKLEEEIVGQYTF